jgi:hypothetical protein
MKFADIQCSSCGKTYPSNYFNSDKICQNCLAEAQAGESKEATSIKLSEVKIVDFDMPFWSMAGFMIKWAFATIPALIVLFIVGMVLGSVFNISLIRLFR